MPYKALSSTSNDKTRASLIYSIKPYANSNISYSNVIQQSKFTKVNCPYARGIWAYKLTAEMSHYLPRHVITHQPRRNFV